MAIQFNRDDNDYGHFSEITNDMHAVRVRKVADFNKPQLWRAAEISWDACVNRSVESTNAFAKALEAAITEAEWLDQNYPTGSEIINAG